MNLAVLSVSALALAVIVSCVSRLNVGVLSVQTTNSLCTMQFHSVPPPPSGMVVPLRRQIVVPPSSRHCQPPPLSG